MSDLTSEQLAAWQKGVEKAKEQLALQRPDDHTTTVSLYRYPMSNNYESPTYKLCRICGWARDSEKCNCVRKPQRSPDEC